MQLLSFLYQLIKVEKAFYDSKAKEIRLLVNNTGKATTRARTEWNLRQNGKPVNSGKLEETTDKVLILEYQSSLKYKEVRLCLKIVDHQNNT